MAETQAVETETVTRREFEALKDVAHVCLQDALQEADKAKADLAEALQALDAVRAALAKHGGR